MLTRLLAMDLRLCLSVSVSVTSRCSIEMDRRMELFLAYGFLSTSPTLRCKRIQISTEIRILPSGTLFETPDLKTLL